MCEVLVPPRCQGGDCKESGARFRAHSGCSGELAGIQGGKARRVIPGRVEFHLLAKSDEYGVCYIPGSLGLHKPMCKHCLNKGLHTNKVWFQGEGRADPRDKGTGRGSNGSEVTSVLG